MPENIGGTVIQRSFVGRGVANIIHIATAPTGELGLSSESLEDIVCELLAVPRESVLNERDYSQVIRDFARRPGYLWPYVESPILEGFYRPFRSPDLTPKEFVGDFLSLISSPIGMPAINPIAYSIRQREQPLGVPFEIHEDAFHLALLCLSSKLARKRDVESFYNEMLTYEIPLGQSPETKGESLLKLLESSKKVCLAPLALGGAQGVNLLAQGNYVAALLTTGTAGLMTLVLIGTVSVGSVIVQRIAQRRRGC